MGFVVRYLPAAERVNVEKMRSGAFSHLVSAEFLIRQLNAQRSVASDFVPYDAQRL